jgi:CheY-like chemotaxis protein
MFDFKKLFKAAPQPEQQRGQRRSSIVFDPKSHPLSMYPANVPLRVLLVDDDEIGAELTHDLLAVHVRKVTWAKTSQEAMSMARETGPFDVAAIDYNLGPVSKLNGVELAMELRGIGVRHTIGLTGNSSADIEKRWEDAKTTALLIKPFDTDHLAACIKQIYASQKT